MPRPVDCVGRKRKAGPMTWTVYHYANCGTCKKASRWLEDAGVAHEIVPIKEAPPSRETLASLIEQSGLPLKRFFNTSGKSYRSGGFSEKLKSMSDDEAIDALAADPMLIKRPLVDTGDGALVGFKPAEWESKKP